MEALVIAQTQRTPLIDFNPSAGNFVFKGRSIPDNSVEFYKPVFEWLVNYFNAPAGITSITFSLDYYNTSSAKCLADIFKKLEAVHQSGASKIQVIWEYQEFDEDMLEAGEEFKANVTFPLDTKAVK